MTEIACIHNHLDPTVRVSQLTQDAQRLVTGTVVDEEKFEVVAVAHRPGNRIQTMVQISNIALFVEARQHDAQAVLGLALRWLRHMGF